jgi:hypothetical protein
VKHVRCPIAASFGLVLALLLVTGCSSDKPSAATPTTTATATGRLVTLTPPAVLTVARPTSVPSPRPITTPTVPGGPLSFQFGPGVPQGDRAIVIDAIETTRKLLTTQINLMPPTVVLANDRLDGLMAGYTRYVRNDRGRATEIAGRLQNGVAEAGYRAISIYTGGTYWRDANAVQRYRVISHEYVHVMQLELLGPDLAERTFLSSPTQTPAAGPFWLLEGSADLLSWEVIEALRLGNVQTELANYATELRAETPMLGSMESYFGFAGAGKGGVARSVLATDFLLQNHQLTDLFVFWGQVRSGRRWEDAFASSFGMSVADFYRAFAATANGR